MDNKTNITKCAMPVSQLVYCEYVSKNGLHFDKKVDTHDAFSVDLMRYVAVTDATCLYTENTAEVEGENYKNLYGVMEINGTKMNNCEVKVAISRKNKKSSTRTVSLSCQIDKSQHRIRAGDTFKLYVFCRQGSIFATNVRVFYRLTPESEPLFKLPHMKTKVKGSILLNKDVSDGTYSIDGLKSITISNGAISLNFEKVMEDGIQCSVNLEKLY